MMRVLVITYYWPPAGGAGVQRWLKLCKYLPQFGILPTIITVDPKHATYPQQDDSLMAEVNPDVEVIRTDSFEPLSWYGKVVGKKNVPYGGFANVSNKGLLSKLSRFIRGNFFIPDARKGWNKFAYRAAVKAIAEKEITLVVTTGTPHSTHLIGMKLKRDLGIKWVADFRDPWTDIYYNDLLLRTRYSAKKDQLYEKQVLDSADLVVANCNSNQKLLQKKGCSAPVHVVENGYDAEDFVDMVYRKENCFNIVYTGTMAASYNPQSFLAALKELASYAPDEVVWHIAGRVDDEIKSMIEDYGISSSCIMHGYIPHQQAVKLLVNADLLLNMFPETANDHGIPGKLFEYLAVRRPVLNLGPVEGDSAQIISECQSGFTFQRGETTEVTNYLLILFDDWKRGSDLKSGNGEVMRYSRQELAKRYAGLIQSLNHKD